MKEADLSPLRQSILREIGSVGTAHAATSLAKMTGLAIVVQPTDLHILSLRKVRSLFEDQDEPQVGVFTYATSGTRGAVFFFLPERVLDPLVATVAAQVHAGTNPLASQAPTKIFQEVGNILCASYISAISRMAELTITMAQPKVIHDRRGTIVQAILEEHASEKAIAILIRNTFTYKELSFAGYFLMVLHPEEMTKLIESMEESIR